MEFSERNGLKHARMNTKTTIHDRIFSGLTDAQREAVEHIEGPLLVLAGPGSGKTRVVVSRIANLLEHGIPGRQIVALTFTNKAADEMKTRLESFAPDCRVWLGTFHKFCSRILREYAATVGLGENFSILDTDDSAQALRMAIDEEGIELTHASPDTIASSISWAKSNLISPTVYTPTNGNAVGALTKRIYPLYQKRLIACNAVDFDDLLYHVAILLKENPEIRKTLDKRYRYILVDEYQDTNFAQYAIARSLSIDHPNLSVTGDPDQSIYGWRGANLNNILDFERDYPKVKVVKLEQNYRSTKSILRVADTLIANNIKRKKKQLFTENSDGSPVRLTIYPTGKDEAQHIADTISTLIRKEERRPRDFAILYRTNALSRTLEHALRSEGIPYQIARGTEFYQRKEIKDVLAYLSVIHNQNNDVQLLRIINTPPRGIGKSTVDRMVEHARRYGVSLMEAVRAAASIVTLTKKPTLALAKFGATIDRLAAVSYEPLEALMGRVLSESGYRDWLTTSDTEEDMERLANIEELLTAAREYDEQHPEGGLEGFLEFSALASDTDDLEGAADRVTMMTLHAAKGLEFPHVFVVALEQGILPHERSIEQMERLEEERRLLFVGITRAKEELWLSLAQKRDFRGRISFRIPSQFAIELPRNEMEVQEPRYSRNALWQESQIANSGDEEDSQVHHEDYVDSDIASTDDGGEKKKREAIKVAPLMTGADLLRNKELAERFHQGQTVAHPVYGLGEIVSLGGLGGKRVATVKFFELPGEEKKFYVAHAPLAPVE